MQGPGVIKRRARGLSLFEGVTDTPDLRKGSHVCARNGHGERVEGLDGQSRRVLLHAPPFAGNSVRGCLRAVAAVSRGVGARTPYFIMVFWVSAPFFGDLACF